MTGGRAIVLNGSMVSVKGFLEFSVYMRVNVVNLRTVVTPANKNELGMNDEQIQAFEAEAALEHHWCDLEHQMRLTESSTTSHPTTGVILQVRNSSSMT